MPCALASKAYQSMYLLQCNVGFALESDPIISVSIVDRRMWVLPGDSLEERGGLPLIVLLEEATVPTVDRPSRPTNQPVGPAEC